MYVTRVNKKKNDVTRVKCCKRSKMLLSQGVNPTKCHKGNLRWQFFRPCHKGKKLTKNISSTASSLEKPNMINDKLKYTIFHKFHATVTEYFASIVN